MAARGYLRDVLSVVKIAFFSVVFVLCAIPLHSEPGAITALDALKLLPRGEGKNVARIEAREGTPNPDRWHILTHDDKAENGLHEYVIAGGEVIASRTLSQFADAVAPADVIGGDAVKVDSDRAAKLAQQFASANNLTVAAMHYALKKDGAEAAPLWTVTCVDENGETLATLVVTATRGAVVSHEGFELEPAAVQPVREKLRTKSTAVVAARDSKEKQPTVARAIPVEEEEAERRPGFLDRVGGSIQKIFTGREPQGNR